ncbi:MAG: sugar nucleotide-binding protein [Elusimicrobia bacterium]|nr:sugar nucleotide-binding protein [Elusimicrobiota bacterium]
MKKVSNNKKNIKVLVLGKDGMLGNMVYTFLKYKKIAVFGTQPFDKNKPFYLNMSGENIGNNYFNNISSGIDYVVNCIGMTELDRTDSDRFKLGFYINAIFPYFLQRFCLDKNIKIIHMSTDGVFKGDKDVYNENCECDGIGEYALSKIIGEVFAPNVLNIRCSIIGNSIDGNHGLLDWFLSKKESETIQGYTNNIWNGITTLQFSEFVYDILQKNMYNDVIKKTKVIHFSPNLPLSKCELLALFKEIYKKNITINPVQAKENTKRILDSKYGYFYLDKKGTKKDIREAMIEMKKFNEIVGCSLGNNLRRKK